MAGPTLTSHDLAGYIPANAPGPPHSHELARRLQEDAFAYPFPPRWMVDDMAPAFGVPFRGGASGTLNDRKGGRDLPLIWNEIDLRAFRVLSRHLCDTNDFAIGFLGLLVGYNVRKGFGWQCCRPGVKKAAYAAGSQKDAVVEKGQKILDQWRDQVLWPVKSREAYRRFRRDGECIGRLFHGGYKRLPRFRFADPAQLGSPTGDTDGDESFGIATHPQDVEDVRAFHFWEIGDGGVIEGSWEDARGVVFVKANVDSDVKRGIPDFMPVHDNFDGVRKLLRNMLTTGIRQAAVAWREKFPTATAAQVTASVPYVTTSPGNTVSASSFNAPTNPSWPNWMGSPNSWARIEYSGVQKVEGNREFIDGPTATSVPNYVQVVQASMRAVCARFGLPEYATGDASNNNFASALVASSPFSVMMEGSQTEWGALWERPVALKVLDYAVEAGILSREERRQLDVEVTPPAVVNADPDKETNRRASMFDRGVISAQEWILEDGRDPAHTAANLKSWNVQPEPKQPDAPEPGQDGGGELGQLTAQFGESKRVREMGPPPFPGAVFNTSSHRWEKPDAGQPKAKPPAKAGGALPKDAKAAGEAMAAALAAVDPKLEDPALRAKVAANWAKILRGRVISSGAEAEALASAVNANAESPAFKELTDKYGAQAVVLVRSDADSGSKRGESVGATALIYSHDIEPIEHKSDPPKPGMATSEDADGVAAVLRHEYAHRVYSRHLDSHTQTEWRQAVHETYPDSKELKAELTAYAASRDNPEETFCELVAIGTHPAYDPAAFTPRAAALIKSAVETARAGKFVPPVKASAESRNSLLTQGIANSPPIPANRPPIAANSWGDANTPLTSRTREDAGTPPFPGAVFDKSKHRWVKPNKPTPKEKPAAKKDDPAATATHPHGDADPDARRPSRPENRHPGNAPKVQKWKEPPTPQGKLGGGKAVRPKGEQSQTKLGDKAEEKTAELGFRNILPEGKRSNTDVATEGSSIDVEYDHSGRAYEVKMCKTTATEYRAKPKKEEIDGKLEFAKKHGLEPYTLLAVMDQESGEIHYYASKEPGIITKKLSPEHFDYVGTVKL